MTGTLESRRDWSSHWATIGARAAPDDFFAQVERTVGGKPVPAEQIALLVEAVSAGLQLERGDILLDLCCGNGMVTRALAARCRAATGVDYAEDLIDSARRHHQTGSIDYVRGAVADLALSDCRFGRPSKVCMNAGLQYFQAAMTRELLRALEPVAGRQAPLYFSDVPDADRLFDFYDTPERRAELERRLAAGTEAVGTWWSRPHLRRLLEDAGYSAVFIEQDPRRLTARYRFDLLARPA